MLIFFALFVFSAHLAGQKAALKLLTDPSKPYAYLTFDHAAVIYSEALQESQMRLFIRVSNNCNLPILFRASGETSPKTSTFEDEVIPEPQGIQVVSDIDQQSFDQKQAKRTQALANMPNGNSMEVSGVLRLMPGESALFTVPRNHVGPYWYFRIRFAFDLDSSSIATGPFTEVDFHEYNIPGDKR